MREADKQGVRVLCLPELCVTGYTCGDLFLQPTLLRGRRRPGHHSGGHEKSGTWSLPWAFLCGIKAIINCITVQL